MCWIPDDSAVMFVETEQFYIKKAQRLKNAGLLSLTTDYLAISYA